MKAFGKAISSFGAKTFAFGAAALAPFALATKSFADAGSLIQDMVDRTGLSAEEVSRLGFAARQSATSVEVLQKGIVSLNRVLVEAAQGSQSVQADLHRLGLTASSLLAMTPHDRFLKVADALSKIPDAGIRAAMALKLLGKGAVELLPLINGGADGIKAMEHQADLLGLTMSSEAAASAEKFGDALQILNEQVSFVRFSIGHAVQLALAPYIKALQGAGKVAIVWVTNHKKLIATAAVAAAVLTAAGAAITSVGAAIFGAGMIIGAMKTAFVVLMNPITLVVAGIVLFGAMCVKHSTTARNAFWSVWQKFSEVFGLIIQLIMAGEMQAAWDLATEQLKVAWQSGLMSMENSWRETTNTIAVAWVEMIGGMKIVWLDFMSWWKDQQFNMADALLDAGYLVPEKGPRTQESVRKFQQDSRVTLGEDRERDRQVEKDNAARVVDRMVQEKQTLKEDQERKRKEVEDAQTKRKAELQAALDAAKARANNLIANLPDDGKKSDFSDLDFKLKNPNKNMANTAISIQTAEAQRSIIATLGFNQKDKTVLAIDGMKNAIVAQQKDTNKKLDNAVVLGEL